MTKVFNRVDIKSRRQLLKRNTPRAEIILWQKLRNRQHYGYKFRRQYSIDKYILDFYCPQAKLAIEVDGDSHYTNKAPQFDKVRQNSIENYGIIVLRFTNHDVYNRITNVLEAINSALVKLTSP